MAEFIKEELAYKPILIETDLPIFVATVGLICATLALVYTTYRLVKATTQLGKLQIKPHLIGDVFPDQPHPRHINFEVRNRGLGTALIKKFTATNSKGKDVFFERLRDDIPPGVSESYYIESSDKPIKMRCEYTDIEGNPCPTLEYEID